MCRDGLAYLDGLDDYVPDDSGRGTVGKRRDGYIRQLGRSTIHRIINGPTPRI